jgi:hypothetical protein
MVVSNLSAGRLKTEGPSPGVDDGPLAISILRSISAASSGRGGRPKKTDANNGDENDAQNTHGEGP